VPQDVVSGLVDQVEVVVAGLQNWQVFAGLVAPLPTSAPPIQHPLWQVAPLQTCPVPQPEPLALDVHEVSAYAVWQVWQAFAGLAAPFA
jgi:hypothetical protein